jgi:hypothetical protein
LNNVVQSQGSCHEKFIVHYIVANGIDIIGHIISNKDDFPRALFCRYKYGDMIRKAVRDDHMKYIFEIADNEIKEYLFNLESDIGEKHNLIGTEKKELLRLKKLMEEWELGVKPERLQQ